MASPSTPPSSWNHSTWTWEPPELPAPPGVTAFQRVWRTFMLARLGIAVALLALLGGMMVLGLVPLDYWQLSLCAVYLGGVLAVRLLTRPAPRGRSFDPQWVSTIGVDLLTFSTLHFLQTAGLNFTPLFALPVLTASVLGSTLLALGTAASVALLLLVDAWLQALHLAEFAPRLAQAGLAGGGYFLIALLANQLAMRLEREENAARRSLSAARTQTHVNQVVIESLSDGCWWSARTGASTPRIPPPATCWAGRHARHRRRWRSCPAPDGNPWPRLRSALSIPAVRKARSWPWTLRPASGCTCACAPS
jgi:two-component system sensor histidine kinase PilS (NtrC family)